MIQVSDSQSNSDLKEQVHVWANHQVLRRNREVSPFNPQKIAVAIAKAFQAVKGVDSDSAQSAKEIITQLTKQVCVIVTRRSSPGIPIDIESIQDQVELALMRSGEHQVARAYVLYREKRTSERSRQSTETVDDRFKYIQILDPTSGKTKALNVDRLHKIIQEACAELEDVDAQAVIDGTLSNLYNRMSENELNSAMIMSARVLIEKEPNYAYVASRLLLAQLRNEAIGCLYNQTVDLYQSDMQRAYSETFGKYIESGIAYELLDPKLGEAFDLVQLGQALDSSRDLQFTYLGLQTLYDRYFLHHKETRIELPQVFFMRVAMGLALNEKNKNEKAIEFYRLLSSFDFMSSTPTLFNSGTLRPQLSSCYLTTIGDDLDGIYESIKDNALLSKFAGGLGNDWTAVRAMGARIKGTNGKSQGVVPFLKVANDTAVAVNQGGKRKGAVCAYLETWHLDIEEFLELRKNTGDDRRRTHDMNTANWIPDLFMQRVAQEGDWTLFSPHEVPDLHELYGKPFAVRYTEYEQMLVEGKVQGKTLKAVDLWRKILSMLYETGHPWITFKDPCNLRSPQQHAGVVHSSNLCTEITLNTNKEEIAVCNLGSVNLVQHLTADGQIDQKKLQATVRTAMRMLDNVIEYNYYSVAKAEVANLRHRPVGLGLMGFQDALHQLKISYSSEQAVEFSDRSMELISYYAISASMELAEERGAYQSFKGSLWDKGVLPIDSIGYLREARNGFLKQDQSSTLDWARLRKQVKATGMRNSNTMAIAPTATIANICGISQSIEPNYKNLYVKSNLSGEFTIVNPSMVKDLKREGLWDEKMIEDLKFYDGDLSKINRVPDHLKELYKTAFEMDSGWLIECASRRQKWIDQAQSLNLYLANPSGEKLDNLYKLAWVKGLKTTYYLRSISATSIEKSTLASSSSLNQVTLAAQSNGNEVLKEPKFCSITDPDCEACQ